MKPYLAHVALVLCALAEFASASAAQRSFVSGSGVDANPCTITQPCRTFATAVTQTAANGEVIVLDSAGYGPVTITQSVSIIAPPGVYAGITVPSGSAGVTVSAPATDAVTLRGLTITSGSNFGTGIYLATARMLTIDRCTIRAPRLYFSAPGARPPPPSFTGVLIGSGTFLIRDSMIEGADTGLWAVYAAPGPIVGAVESSTIHDTWQGIIVGTNVSLTVANSLISGAGASVGVGGGGYAYPGPVNIHISNTRIERFGTGVSLAESWDPVRLTIVASDVTQNGSAIASSGNATISLSDVRVTQNQNGVNPLSSPVFTSGTNFFRDNVSDGPPMIGPIGIK